MINTRQSRINWIVKILGHIRSSAIVSSPTVDSIPKQMLFQAQPRTKIGRKMLLTEDDYSCSLSKETQEIARVELNEHSKTRKKALAEVRKWIKSQPHFRRARLDSNFILRFLRMQKFEIKESCEILDKYMTMRYQYPAWFQNLDCKVRNFATRATFPC